jgi:curli biogenesis system outer membrane secretion channel CsgG
MKFQGIVYRWAATLLLASAAQAGLAQETAPAAAQEMVKEEPVTSFSVTGRYTAQRKPRVAVLEFEDTNSQAKNQKYGSSVQAMLVTYLKRKSQVVVVERQKLGDVIAEWRRNQNGLTNLEPEDPSAREILEKLDAIIIGSVTLLDEIAKADTQAGKGHEGVTRQGQRIEIDAKLLSRSDGRIIAAAQRDGPVSCLRAIVERLGVALEQEYLRPYFGKLKVTLSEPEQVTVFLTPILLDTALDEEKPPVERGATIRSEPKKDTVEPWTTDPSTYTIENLLSGWYSMRLERPGYEGQRLESSQWEARDNGVVQVYDRSTSLPLERVPFNLRRFVVHVDPLAVETLTIDKLGFTFRKLGGSIDPLVKRQYLDQDYKHHPQRVVLISRERVEDDPEADRADKEKAQPEGGEDEKKGKEKDREEHLEINDLRPPGEYGDDEDCDLFEEKTPNRSDFGRTVVTSGQIFDFEAFTGGGLFIEDYRGEVLPVGDYQMTVWEPHYQPRTFMVTVRDQDKDKPVRTSLVRETGSLALATTGTRPSSKVILEGTTTHHRVDLPLDFESWKVQESLPVDVYRAATDINGLIGWSRDVELKAKHTQAPYFDTRDEERGPILKLAFANDAPGETEQPEIPRQRIKTRLAVGGRLSVFSVPPDPVVNDLYVDQDLTVILDLLLYAKRKGEEEADRSVWWGILAGIGKEVLRQVADDLVAPGSGQRAAAPSETVAPPTQTAAPPGGAQPGPVATGQSSPSPPAAVEPASLPIDAEALRSLFASHLQDLDLLVLDDEDLARMREMPEVSAILNRYVEAGGSVFAFATEDGDYSRLLGSSLVLRADGKPTESFEISPGEVSGISLRAGGKKVKVKTKRVLPELQRLDAVSTWRVVAFGKGHRDVRILERGYRDQGGYVAVWLDHPASFHGHWGGTIAEVEEVRSRIERYVMDWTRSVMQRRYGKVDASRAANATPR